MYSGPKERFFFFFGIPSTHRGQRIRTEWKIPRFQTQGQIGVRLLFVPETMNLRQSGGNLHCPFES